MPEEGASSGTRRHLPVTADLRAADGDRTGVAAPDDRAMGYAIKDGAASVPEAPGGCALSDDGRTLAVANATVALVLAANGAMCHDSRLAKTLSQAISPVADRGRGRRMNVSFRQACLT